MSGNARVVLESWEVAHRSRAFGREMRKFVSVILTILVLVCGAFAQARSESGEKVYRLRQQDLIRIQVFNQQQVSGEFEVGEDGNVTVPFGGIVKAEGRTIPELEKDLYDVYVKRLKLRDPIVSVTIVKYRPSLVFINGFVSRPSAIQIRPGDTVLTVIAQAGGIIKERADSRRCRLKRKAWNEEIPLDLYSLTELGDLSQNYVLEDGDTIEVPELENNLVTVLGAIQRPGAFPYREAMAVSDAIGLAGGEIPYRSRFSKTRILRRDIRRNQVQVINCDFVAFMTKNDFSQNVKLQPGDVVFIPTSNSPDLTQVNALINTAFILQTFGSIFGLRLVR